MARRPKLNQREIIKLCSLAPEVQHKKIPFLYPMMELVLVVVAVVEEQEMEDLVEGLALEVDRWLEEDLQVLV